MNIHPCNVFLAAKIDWQQWGGKRDVIDWVTCRYLDRYGDLMASFLNDVGADHSNESEPVDPHYSYSREGEDQPSKIVAGSAVPTKPSGTISFNRPTIIRKLVGQGFTLKISTQGRRYRIAHDDMVDWVRSNMNALNTSSWIDNGVYSWAQPTKQMAVFLERYEA